MAKGLRAKRARLPLTAQLTLVLVVIFLIPVITLTIQQNFTRIDITQQEIASSAMQQLKTSENVFDLIIAEAQRNALVLSLDKNLSQLAGATRLTDIARDGEAWSTVYTLAQTLDSLQYSNDCYHSVAVILTGADYVLLSGAGAVSREEYIDSGWVEPYETYLREKTPLGWLPTRYVPGQTTSYRQAAGTTLQPDNYVITYLYPLTLYTTRVTGVILINVRASAVVGLLSAAHGESSEPGARTVALDWNGNVLLDPDPTHYGKPFPEDILSRIAQAPWEGSFTAAYEGEQTLVTYYASRDGLITFLSLYPLAALTSAWTRIALTSAITTALWLVLGAALSAFLASRIARPVRALVSTVRRRGGLDAQGYELDILSQAFLVMSEHESQLYDQLEHNRDNIRVGSLMALLGGAIPEPGNDLVLRFPHRYACCAILSIDHQDQYLHYARRDGEQPLTRAASRLARRFSDTLLAETALLNATELAVVFSGGGSPQETTTAIEDILAGAIQTLRDASGLSFSAGVGGLTETLAGLPASLREARDALSYKLVAGLGTVLFYGEYAGRRAEFYYPYAPVNRVFNLLRGGDNQQIIDAVHALVQDIRDHDRLRHENIQAILYQVFSDLMRYLMESERGPGELLKDSAQLIRQLSSLETLEEVDRWMTQVLLQIADAQRPPAGDEDELAVRILSYLDAHRHEELSLSALAEHFGISYSHLRRVFSHATGDSILNYVNNRRMQDAKRLLVETDIPIGQLSQKLGYVNKQSFYRFFKRSEGVTPSEYRSIHGGSGKGR